MPTFDDLKREAEKEIRIRQEAELQEKERQRQEQLWRDQIKMREARVEEDRKQLEMSRWATPQQAYHTLEKRIRTLVDYANQYRHELLDQSRRALSAHGSQRFGYFKAGMFGRVTKGHVTPSEFGYTDLCASESSNGLISGTYTWAGNPGWLYQITWGRRAQLIDNGLATDTEKFEFYDPASLEEAIRQILLPKLVAEKIAKGQGIIFNIAEVFLREGKLLLTTPQSEHNFWCNYQDEEIEDHSVTISNSGYDSGIPNPYFKDDIRKLLLEHTELVSMRPQGGGGGRGSNW